MLPRDELNRVDEENIEEYYVEDTDEAVEAEA
jgi:hypothetical protein